MNFPENWTSLMSEFDTNRDLFVYAVVAVQDNGGIGNGMQLPWPSLKKDFHHYTSLMKASPGYIHDNEFYMKRNTLRNKAGSELSTQSINIDKVVDTLSDGVKKDESVLRNKENVFKKDEFEKKSDKNDKKNNKNEIKEIKNKKGLENKNRISSFDMNPDSLDRVQKRYKMITKLYATKQNNSNLNKMDDINKTDETVENKDEVKLNISNKELIKTSTNYNNNTKNVSQNPKSELKRNLKTKTSKSLFPTIVVIGRKTWDCMGKGESDVEGVLFVVLSRNELISSKDPNNKSIVVTLSCFTEVLCLSYALYKDNIITRVCVCGGGGVYKAAIESGYCSRLYVTRIQASFPCDAFMPPFEHLFQQDRTTVEGVKMGEKLMESGVEYHFEEYALMT